MFPCHQPQKTTTDFVHFVSFKLHHLTIIQEVLKSNQPSRHIMNLNVGHFDHGHFGLGRFGPDISPTPKVDVSAKTINCGLGCVHA